MKKDWKKKYRGKGGLMLLALVPILWYVVFCYVPMYGVQIAFKKYNPSLGILGSPWVGLKYFRQFFESYYFTEITLNTIILSLYTLLIGFPLPIILALIVNEIRSPFLKKSVQNITYIPHFLSVVVIVSMLNIFSNPTYGFFNDIREFFGLAPVDLMAKPEFFRPMYVFSNVWQHMGFNSIIYIAALSAIDPALYEAATIDGASRFKKIIYISLPSIVPTIMVLFIMRIGSIMNVGFEKVLLMQNPINKSTSEIISTFIYTNGIQKGQFSYSTAVGLFNSVINCTLLLVANKASKKLTGSGLW
ncbi:MAG: ABC transporter permease [Bullifex sp.]